MAEFVELRSEKMIPDLEEMELIGLFKKWELKSIARTRKEHEYRIQRRTKCKNDFLLYIQYEVNLLKVVKLRSEDDGYSSRVGNIIRTISNRVEQLYKNVIFKFQHDVMLWKSYFKFCKSVGSKSSVNSMLVRMLQVHGDDPDLWILASEWELGECSSAENARLFLWRGLRSHSESRALYLELFRLELKCIDEKRKAEAEAPVAKRAKMKTEPIHNENTPWEKNIRDGRLAEVVYVSAVRKIVNAEFVIELIDIAKEYDSTQKLQSRMIEDLLAHPEHSNNELVWDMLARRELDGIGYRTAAGATLFTEDLNPPDKESKITRKEKIRLCVAAYKSFITQLPTKRMWSFYLDALIELNQDLTCLPMFKQKLLREGFQAAHSARLLEVKFYWQWVDFLNGTKDINRVEKVLRHATQRFPSNFQLWEMRLSHHLSRDEVSAAEEVLEQAIAKLPSDSEVTLPLWMDLIKHHQMKKSAKQAQKVFEKVLKLGTPVSTALRPVFIEWLVLTKGVGAARKEYEILSLQSPLSLELHMKMIKLETTQPKVNLKQVRKCFEVAVSQFGRRNTDLWMGYVKFELQQGDPMNVSTVYDRAVKTLEHRLADIFVMEFSVAKTGSPTPT